MGRRAASFEDADHFVAFRLDFVEELALAAEVGEDGEDERGA